MPIVKNLTTREIESIQIDEGVVIINYGETDERPLVPCRGGGEFIATANIRDIEFDGRNGKTAGTQVIDEQAADLKVTTISMTPENLWLALPFARIFDANGQAVTNPASAATIKNPKMGIIPSSAYLVNVTMFAKLVGGTFKKITLYKPMTEEGIDVKAVQKAEGELALDFHAHYGTDDLDGELWEVTEISSFEMRRVAAGGSGSNSGGSESGSGSSGTG